MKLSERNFRGFNKCHVLAVCVREGAFGQVGEALNLWLCTPVLSPGNLNVIFGVLINVTTLFSGWIGEGKVWRSEDEAEKALVGMVNGGPKRKEACL